MRFLTKYACALMVVTSLVVAGCSTAKELGKTLNALAQVRDEIITRTGEKNVGVNANSFQNRTSISVTFINSPLNEKSVEERAKRAQETATLVKERYPAIKSVDGIWVAYARQTTYFLIFHSSQILEAYAFDKEGRARREPPSDPSKPTISYSASQNTTEVSSNIQLQGTPDDGVILVTHFSLEGDVNKVTPTPPKEVSFDFASFSVEQRFPTKAMIVFLTDDTVSYQTAERFSSSKLADGKFCEFLYLKIPSSAFVKIASGNEVRIRLDSNEYRLNVLQLLQLQRMSDYLKK